MLFVVVLMLAIATLFYIAATFQYQGYVWFDQTCASFSSFCEHPNSVAIGCIAVIVFFMIGRTMKGVD